MGQFKRIDPNAIYPQSLLGLRPYDRDLLKVLADINTSLTNLFDRGLTFSENMETEQIDYASNAVPDTEDAVTHGLGKVPSGFIVVNRDKAGIIYSGLTAWDSSTLYLRCNTASVTASIIVF